MGPRQSQYRLSCRAFFAVADLNLELPKADFFHINDEIGPTSFSIIQSWIVFAKFVDNNFKA